MVSVATMEQETADRYEGVGIGVAPDLGNRPVWLSDQVLAGHLLAVGMSRTGKSTLLRRLAQERAAAGDRVVLVDPHGDLARQMAGAGWGHLADFGSGDDEAALGLLDPRVFPEREQCVAAVLGMLRCSWSFWSPSLETGLRLGLETLYEFNRNPVTADGDAASPLDLLELLMPDETGGARRQQVAERVQDADLRGRLERCVGLSEMNSDVVRARLGAFRMSRKARRALDVGCSSDIWCDRLRQESVALISAGAGQIGLQTAGLLASAATNWAFNLLREQGGERRSLLVVDEFDRASGVDWCGRLSEAAAYGCSVALASVGAGQCDEPLSAALSGCGTLAVFPVSRRSVALASEGLGWPETEALERLSGLDPYCCYLREPGLAPVGVRLTLLD